jgi:hypothetical protein
MNVKIPHFLPEYRLFIAISFFVAITIVFFFPSLFLGRIPLPTDLLHSYLLDEPHTGANPLIRDSMVQLFPYADFIYKSYSYGRIPLWDPYIFSGINFAATGQANIFSPFNFFIPLFSSSGFFTFKVIASFFISGFGFFLYLYHGRRYAFLVSLLIGLGWQMSGPFIGWMSWGTIVGVIAWLPLMMLSVERFFTDKKVVWLILFTVFNFFSLTAGHLQFYFYVLAFSGLYFAYICVKTFPSLGRREKWLALLSVCVNAFLVYAVIHPFVQNFSASHRVDLINASHLTIGSLPLFFLPNFWGDWLHYRGPLNYLETLVYIGVVPIMLVLLSFVYRKLLVNFKDKVFWAVIVLLLCVYNFSSLAGQALPFLKNFPPFRSIFLFLFILLLLASHIINEAAASRELLRKKMLQYVLMIAGCLFAITALLVYKNNQAGISWDMFWYGQLGHLVIVAAIVLFLLIFYSRAKITFSALVILMIVVAFFDQYALLGRFTPQQSTEPIANPPHYVVFLQNQAVREPLIYSELTPTDVYQLYNIRSLFGYDSTYPEKYYQLIKDHGQIISHHNILNARIDDYQFLRKSGVNYVVTKREIPQLKNVFDDGVVKIYTL